MKTLKEFALEVVCPVLTTDTIRCYEDRGYIEIAWHSVAGPYRGHSNELEQDESKVVELARLNGMSLKKKQNYDLGRLSVFKLEKPQAA